MPDEQRSSASIIVVVFLIIFVLVGITALAICAGVGWFMIRVTEQQQMPPQPVMVREVPPPLAPQEQIRPEPNADEGTPENTEAPKAERDDLE